MINKLTIHLTVLDLEVISIMMENWRMKMRDERKYEQ